MSAYHGSLCPVCHKVLEETDEIVVCPICGAAYHKDCYAKAGACLFPQLHEKGEDYAYVFPEKEKPPVEAADDQVCPRCGTRIDRPDRTICPICGSVLPTRNQGQSGNPYGASGASNASRTQDGFGPFSAPGSGNAPGTNGAPGMQPPYPPLPFSPFGSPFGGVDPEEEFQGVKAKWMVVFLQRNSAYFMARFHRYAQKMPIFDFNWCAVLFGPFYFLYRKMYGWAAVSAAAYLLFWVPMMVISLLAVSGNAGFTGAGFDILSYLLWFGCYGVRFGMGFLANRLYYKHVVKKVSKQYASSGGTADDAMLASLAKKGGVSMLVPVLVIYCLIMLSYAATQWVLPTWFPELSKLIENLASGSANSLFG